MIIIIITTKNTVARSAFPTYIPLCQVQGCFYLAWSICNPSELRVPHVWCISPTSRAGVWLQIHGSFALWEFPGCPGDLSRGDRGGTEDLFSSGLLSVFEGCPCGGDKINIMCFCLWGRGQGSTCSHQGFCGNSSVPWAVTGSLGTIYPHSQSPAWGTWGDSLTLRNWVVWAGRDLQRSSRTTSMT